MTLLPTYSYSYLYTGIHVHVYRYILTILLPESLSGEWQLPLTSWLATLNGNGLMWGEHRQGMPIVGIPAFRTDNRGRVIRLPARYRDTYRRVGTASIHSHFCIQHVNICPVQFISFVMIIFRFDFSTTFSILFTNVSLRSEANISINVWCEKYKILFF